MQPATYISVLLLLIATLVCLGAWINAFKAVGGKWRFELFSLDFAVGGVLLTLLAAFTLGTMGSELGFSDRMLVAGRTAQALAVIAGGVFNLGSMLLLASVGLLGISVAFPFTIGVALIVCGCFHFQPSNLMYLGAAFPVMAVALVFEARAAYLREGALESRAGTIQRKSTGGTATPSKLASGTKPASVNPIATVERERAHKPPPNRKSPRTVKGLIAALIAGICLGLFVPILENCVPNDFGLGAYAGMLLFSIGVLGSTIVYDFYFLNITIEGASLPFNSYFRGALRWHVLGVIAGAVCICGLLAGALAAASPSISDVAPFLRAFLPLLFVPLAFLFGIGVWKELSVPPASRTALLAGLLLFLCGLGLFSFGFTH